LLEDPEFYNIGVDICDKWAGQRYRLALIYENDQAGPSSTPSGTSAPLQPTGQCLRAHGFGRATGWAFFCPMPEAAIAHIAAYKLGAIAVPLFTLFGPDALEYRLANAGAGVVITDAANLEKIAQIRDRLPDLKLLISTAEQAEPRRSPSAFAAQCFRYLQAGPNRADDPALIIYTSGTPAAQGALHATGAVGSSARREFSTISSAQGRLLLDAGRLAWIGGLIDVLLPSWHHGVPVGAPLQEIRSRGGLFFLVKYGVRNAFMPPTALKLMRQVNDPATAPLCAAHHRVGWRDLGEALLAWGREVFGLTINEFYGQTEVTWWSATAARSWRPSRAPWAGRSPATPWPSSCRGRELPAGEVGEVAVRRRTGDVLEYWRNPRPPRPNLSAIVPDRDLGRRDEQAICGCRPARTISSPAPVTAWDRGIEECLLKHPAFHGRGHRRAG